MIVIRGCHLPPQGAARTPNSEPSPIGLYLPPEQKPEAVVHALKVGLKLVCYFH